MPPPATEPTTRGVPLELTGIRRVFDPDVVALSQIDLRISAGEFLAILGPSGCGKSTLLRIIAGLDRPTSGSLKIEKHSNHGTMAYVFQDAHLLPWRNVLQNVAVPLELAGMPRAERLAQATQALEQVGLADAISRYPAQLSGGMKMRVSLARALVTQPRLLLLDEPFAALDEITRQKLDEQLRQLWIDHQMTVIFVTHSTAEATFLADRAIVMSRRPGRIIQDIPINLPRARESSLRADPNFAAITRKIYQALEKSEA
jgi:NitT/TauT family transport system ATP-binding protein